MFPVSNPDWMEPMRVTHSRRSVGLPCIHENQESCKCRNNLGRKDGISMKMRMNPGRMLIIALTLAGATPAMAKTGGAGAHIAPPRPKGPCDIYAAAGDPCVAAYSTTRALYAAYNGPLYQVIRQSDGRRLDIGVVAPSASPFPDAGGYADAAAQDAFCANTYCWIARIYDQSRHHNDLTQAPRGAFSGPAMGGLNNLPLANMAPVTIMGHKVYGVFIEPGMGMRNDDPAGTAVGDQAEGIYWVLNGKHYNAGCCFDFGNGEIDSHDDQAGTMETSYFGDAPYWYHGKLPGPWIMTDQENNLVGCVNSNGSKLCANLPTIDSRFVTAIAKGEPHRWTSMGGNAQEGELRVMFSGPRVNATYDPMRKQGAILLGNGGDNSNGSQGTFYEGAMTAAGTFPANATDQLVQANIVAARYRALSLSMAPAFATAAPPGLQTFSPGTSQETTVTFTNTTGAPVTDVKLSISVPNRQWTSYVRGSKEAGKTFAGTVAPGASVSATFNVTSGPAAFNGDLVGNAWWRNQTNGRKQSETIAEKVRNVSPVRINEFRISSGPPTNATGSFIELYNAGGSNVNISNWTLTVRPTQQAIFSSIKIPEGTKLAGHGFYLFGLSDSGLAASARAGDTTIYVRSTAGMKAGDRIAIGTGSNAETRTIANLGTAASNPTTLWQPLPDGPVITFPAGSTNVPVASVDGFKVGEKIALGYGATYPAVARTVERYELATVTAVGKPGTQAYLAANAPAGATNIQVTSIENISVGDKIRLDIDSVGHGIETVTVTHVGTAARRTVLLADASAGAAQIQVRGLNDLSAGDRINIGTPANLQAVTVTALSASGRATRIDFTPTLEQAHLRGEEVVQLGTGLDLAAPLKFNHVANLPFSDRGTGISFEPSAAFAHSSNEPVQALGTGIALSAPLEKDHAINAVVRDTAITAAGYQGPPAPNQWFGGPELTTSIPGFRGFTWISFTAGSMVLRNAAGLVVDSLNYGGLVDPWAAQGYQAASGLGKSGCYVTAPGLAGAFAPLAPPAASNTSAGRYPDGRDTDSNCNDFVTSPATTLAAEAAAGATNIKVASVESFSRGQTIRIDTGANLETAVVAAVGTAGATTVRAATAAGATEIPVDDAWGFSDGQIITIGSGANSETAVILRTASFREASITVSAPLTKAHARGAQISGTGITLTAPLTREHAREAEVTGSIFTPGAPNRYYRRQH